MKQLATITDKDITGADTLSTAKPRMAVDTVLFDDENNIALCHLGKFDFYTLPGGGVDPGEDLITAAKREVLEEAGCQCKILCEIGTVTENLGEIDCTQTRYTYIARVVGEKGDPQLTEREILLESTVCWHPFEKARQLIAQNIPKDCQQQFIKHRDMIVLNEVLANHADKIGGRP